jgi:hypothetical protein
MTFRDRDNPLFFRADGAMDLAQALLTLIVGWVICLVTLAGFGVLKYSTAAWAFLGSFTSLCFIAWAARDRAELIARSNTPGQVAAGIAGPPFAGMDQHEGDPE